MGFAVAGAKATVESEDDERRISQRRKQVQYGYNTDGYHNMVRLVRADPRLCNGGVLPLEAPSPELRTSKRQWDLLIRKWRRALHMFDHVFIEGEDNNQTTLEEVTEEQRKEWVSATYASYPKDRRVRISAREIAAKRESPMVPKKLPVELSMLCILRSYDKYEAVETVVQDCGTAAARAAGTSPIANTGIKIHVAPSGTNSAYSASKRSPSPTSPHDVATAAARRGTSPTQVRPGSISPVQNGNQLLFSPIQVKVGSGCPVGTPSAQLSHSPSPVMDAAMS